MSQNVLEALQPIQPDASGLPTEQTDNAPVLVERVYFVPRSKVMLGAYPFVEPVVLIDRSLAHRYSFVRALEVIDPPPSPEDAPPLSEARPVMVLDSREVMLFQDARPATIYHDLRAQ